MKKKLMAGLAVGVMMLGMAGMASATNINFDDLTLITNRILLDGRTYGSLDGSAYKGFNWEDGTPMESWLIFAEESLGDGAHSAHNFASNNGGTDISLSSEQLFDFNSMWVRCWYDHSATAKGFANGIEIYHQDFSVNTNYELVSFNFIGVDRVTLSGTLIIDDISVNGPNPTSSPTPTPEPATMFLMGTGLAGLVSARRKKKQ